MAQSSRASVVFALVAALTVLFNTGFPGSSAFVGHGRMPQSAGLRSVSPVVRWAEEGEEAGMEEDDIAVKDPLPTETDRVILKVLTPDGGRVAAAVSEAILPSTSGQLGVLANHAPMMTGLDIGVVRYKNEGKWVPLVINGGFANVADNQLVLLVNELETVDEINVDEARTGLETATQALEEASSKSAQLEATTNVRKASARLQAAMFATAK